MPSGTWAKGTLEARSSSRCRSAGSDSRAVMEVDDAAPEAALVHQFEPQADIRRKSPLAATHDERDEEQVALVDQRGRERVGGERRTANGEVVSRARFQLRDRGRVEVALDPRPRAGHGLE